MVCTVLKCMVISKRILSGHTLQSQLILKPRSVYKLNRTVTVSGYGFAESAPAGSSKNVL
jgi:hypothetical protein